MSHKSFDAVKFCIGPLPQGQIAIFSLLVCYCNLSFCKEEDISGGYILAGRGLVIIPRGFEY